MTSNVLIIDDDASFRKIVELKLRSFLPELHCSSFGNITSAKEFLHSEEAKNLDLVVLDEHLPDGRGTELLAEGLLNDLAVIVISSDTSPEIPGASIQAGATYFINKVNIREALFQPLILGVIAHNNLHKELAKNKANALKLETIKTLVSTLRHEINNPLGTVMGAVYLLKSNQLSDDEKMNATKLVEESGVRIKHVLDELCQATELEPVKKGNQDVFQIPGDKPWK